jgi:hypothetical protein
MTVTCPYNGRPCERGCPNRYWDRPEGGCLFADLAASCDAVIIFDPEPRAEEDKPDAKQ